MPLRNLSYPPTRVVDQVDDYHRTRVADPYRWLEDVDSPETLAWIAAQNALTFAYLEALPAREPIRERLTALWDYPKASAPLRRGDHFFEFRNSGLQNQSVLYVLDAPGSEGRPLLDPNLLSEDGTVALTNWAPSRDGGWLAYAISASGSDWQSWRVRDVATGDDLPDQIEWSKFSGAAWRRDGSGFYYGGYDPPAPGEAYAGLNYYQKVYFHRLGTPQAEDPLIYERPDQKEWGFGPIVTWDGDYLVLSVSQGTDTRNRVFYRALEAPEGEGSLPAGVAVGAEPSENGFVELIPELEAAYHFVGSDGPVFYFRTDLDAPRGRLIAIDVTRPARSHWRTLIPEREAVLEGVSLFNEQFVALYLQDAHHVLGRYAKDGAFLGAIELPALGALIGLTGRREDAELFFQFNSFVYPPVVYRYDFARDTSEVVATAPVAFDPAPYTTRQAFATSKDGTRVPIFLVHRRDLLRDGQNPTLLYGYGGFDVSLTPGFSVSRLVWLEMGGVLAVANLRGGGEYGEAWHRAGMLANKQNVFDDFIACAEYLIAEGYAAPAKLAIQGGSNGGLLVAACMLQRPELFGAVQPAVGVLDMLRFHKFTIGWAWVSDYGSADDPAQFRTLYAYSPLHNLKPGTRYPATLITTGDHDDRVVPGHSFKFAAALQAAQAGDAPILIRIQTKTGHGMGKPTSLLIAEQADVWAFLVDALGVSVTLRA
jgi:prolyl oligopeptidase